MNKENGLIYKRVSSDDQAKDGRHSLNTQESLCRKAIDSSDMYILAPDGVYSDPGRSGTNMDRPGLQDMLIRIQEDKSIKALFVQDTDRLARNANDHLLVRTLLKKHGIKLISVSQPGIEDSPEGNFLDLIMAGVNQLQSQMTGRKTLKSLEQKFNSGWFPTKAPMGYLNARDPKNEDRKIIIEDPVRGPFIRKMFMLYASGNYTLHELRDQLYKIGLRNSKGNMVVRSKIASMLDYTFYYGDMVWMGMTKTGNHPPLITKEIFQKCKKVKAEHNGFRCRKRKYSFLLSGFIYCSYCSKRWTSEFHKEKGLGYYRCNRQSEKIHCIEKYVESNLLEKEIERKFLEMEFAPNFIDRITARAQFTYQREKKNHNKSLESLLASKNNHLRKLETAEEKLISGVFSDDAYTRIKDKMLPLIDSIDIQIAKLNKVKSLKVEVIQKLLSMIRNLGESYKKAPPVLKRLYLSLFWSKFMAGEGKIKEAHLSPVIKELIALGMIKMKDKDKEPPLKEVFQNKSDSFLESIKIRNERVLSIGIEPIF